MATAELACSYAALILADEEIEITVCWAIFAEEIQPRLMLPGRQAPNHH